MKLYSFYRSSASYRVRIALNLKGLNYQSVPVHLRRAEQRAAGYLARNPQGLVPTLETAGRVLTQSLAIIEYLEESHPDPALLPTDPLDRARVRGVAFAIACEIHPLNNLRVLKYLQNELSLDTETRNTWYRHWVDTEFAVLEQRLASESATGRFCHGDTPTLADVCLVPQVFNAQRFDCDMTRYPTIMHINDTCLALPAFRAAAPERQPDAEA